jgi:hypothetical protein
MRNQLLNLTWTIIGFLPICLFWFSEGPNFVLYLFFLLSLVAGLMPPKTYAKLQLSKDLRVYRKLGVKRFQKFTQSGNFGSRGDKRLSNYLRKLSMYERFHYSCMVFFISSAFLALFHAHVLLALGILICNIIYNVCPILLQQYNRIRILKITQH